MEKYLLPVSFLRDLILLQLSASGIVEGILKLTELIEKSQVIRSFGFKVVFAEIKAEIFDLQLCGLISISRDSFDNNPGEFENNFSITKAGLEILKSNAFFEEIARGFPLSLSFEKEKINLFLG